MSKTEGTAERVGGYRVVRRLAVGGTSDVLLAKAEGPQGFERTVVLKLLLSQYQHDEDFKAMFAREAAAYARLSHPSIVRLYDFFASGEQLVMVLEYIDGPSLAQLRGMLKSVGQGFDDATALHIGASIFEALAAAHAASDGNGDPAPVVHRDVNPTNVLVPWDGHVKLADFGIAKVTGASHQSSAGLIKGTYGYMAPEQVKGENVTPRADVYAGAIILWEMLTKRRAFIRGALPEIEVLRELAEPRIPSIDGLRADVSASVRAAIKRALEPRADKRNITAEEMVATLRSALPETEGREQLAKALASVRHEPKATSTSMPPTMGFSPDEEETSKFFPKDLLQARSGAAPAPTPALGPAGSIPRTTAAYGGSLPSPQSPPSTQSTPSPPLPALGAVPRPSGARSPRPPGVAPAVVGEPMGGKPGAAKDKDESAPRTLTAEEMAVAGDAGPPSSLPGLAALLEPSDPRPLSHPSSRPGRAAVQVFDSLVEPPELVRATGRPSERFRLAGPLAGIAPGRDLKDAIDDILSRVPSNVPPNVFPKTDPPGAAPEPPTKNDRRTLADPSARKLGELPQAPAPLTSEGAALADSVPPYDPGETLVMGPGQRAMPSSFPAMNRTLAMVERGGAGGPAVEDVARGDPPGGPPPRQFEHATTAPMLAVTSAPAAQPVGAPTNAWPSQCSPQTPPMASAPPVQPSAPTSGPAEAGASDPSRRREAMAPAPARASSPSVPGADGSGERASSPSGRRTTSTGLLMAVLFATIGAGAAGAAGYQRWQKTRGIALAVTPSSAIPSAAIEQPPIPSIAPPEPAPPSESPSASTSADPSASPSALPSSSAAVPEPAPEPEPASASPSASTSASTPASPPASPPASSPASPPASSPASPPASSPAADAPPAEELSPGTGRITTSTAAPGRRIFVDERTLGQTPEAVVVKCGARRVRLGSSGTTRTIDIPCGGEIAVGDR